jgi:hypothetical protein
LFALIDAGAGPDGATLFAADAARLEAFAPTAPRPRPAISPATPRSGIQIRSLHVAESEVEQAIAARSATGRSAGWSTSAPAPAG